MIMIFTPASTSAHRRQTGTRFGDKFYDELVLFKILTKIIS